MEGVQKSTLGRESSHPDRAVTCAGVLNRTCPALLPGSWRCSNYTTKQRKCYRQTCTSICWLFDSTLVSLLISLKLQSTDEEDEHTSAICRIQQCVVLQFWVEPLWRWSTQPLPYLGAQRQWHPWITSLWFSQVMFPPWKHRMVSQVAPTSSASPNATRSPA
jgi:hypothetical protein